MTTSTTRRSLLALTSLTTGLGTALIPGAAHASAPAAPPDPTPGAAAGSAATMAKGQRQTEITSAAVAATCWSWSTFRISGHPTWRAYLPSINHEARDVNCELANGNASDGVSKLQDALNRCYGANLRRDGIYGTLTENAVRAVQDHHNITVDGRYGPQTRAAMKWPIYAPDNNPNDDDFVQCDRLILTFP
jgi:hypothetical protein